MMETGMNTGNETVNGAVNSLIDQLAQIKFEGLVMYGVIMLAALLICLEGYQIYRLALLIIGFAAGYLIMHRLIEFANVQLGSQQMLMVQGIAGIVCAILAASVVRAGVFISTYTLMRHGLAQPIANMILDKAGEKIKIPSIFIPVILSVLSVIVAILVAKLAVSSLRPVIVIITAACGAFTLVSCFIKIIPLFPFDLSFMPGEGSVIWAAAKLALSCAGVGIQGIKDSE